PDDPEPAEHSSRLYRNRGDGSFDDVTVRAGLSAPLYGMGAAFGDYDGDGDPDIYITAVGTNMLLRNDGGVFVDATERAGVTGNDPTPGSAPSWSTGAAWLDFDRDGRVDLFVCNYVRWTPETDLYTTLDGVNKSYATPEVYDGDSCRLYRNEDGARFTDVTAPSGILNPDTKALGIAVTDVNDDGWPDMAVSNDTEPNHLFLNRRNGTFEDIALTVGVGYDEFGRARAGMGIDIAHVGAAGSRTIAIGNFSREPVSLYTQINPNVFSDRSAALGVANPTLMPLTFGLRFDDFNGDGHLDLMLANGHIEPDINLVQQSISFRQLPQIFLGTGERFVDYSARAGPPFRDSIVGRGVATADFDRDGDLDILITVNDGRARLLRNDLPQGENNWIRVSLEGTPPNTAALGASLTIFTDAGAQRRLVRTASSYLSQSYVNSLIIGIGKARRVDSLLVRWPTTDIVSQHGPVDANSELKIREAEVNGVSAND
ncbi:MAG: CRTAC1 family protein, partial [Gemmatimonadales bacterium]